MLVLVGGSSHRKGGIMVFTRSAVGMAALVVALAAAPAAAQSVTVPSGTIQTTPITVFSNGTVTVQSNATLTTSSDRAIDWIATGSLTIANSGTVTSTATNGHAITVTGGNNTRNFTVTNNAGSLISSQGDAILFGVTPNGGNISISNNGIIRSTDGGLAINLDAVTGSSSLSVGIGNGVTGEIRSWGNDAIHPGQGRPLINPSQGTIISNSGLISADGPAGGNYDAIDWGTYFGTVNNAATGTIVGQRYGITANAVATITNNGTIRGVTAEGIKLVGNFADTITTSGLIAGGNGTAVDMGGGDDRLVYNPGATFSGLVNGGTGNDSVVITSPNGTLDTTNFVSFEQLSFQAVGTWTVATPLNFSSGTVFSGNGAATGRLLGDTSTLVGNFTNARLSYYQTTNGTLNATFTNLQELLKDGPGTLTINDAITTGTIRLLGGTTIINNRVNNLSVSNGAIVTGNFTAGATNISVSTFSPGGDAIGAITVDSLSLVQAIIPYNTSGSGAADRITVLGNASGTASLVVTRDATPYTVGTRYTVMTFSSANGFRPSLGIVQTPVNGTEFRLVNIAGAIQLELVRTSNALPIIAGSPNQLAIAQAFTLFGSSNPAVAALIVIPDDATVRRGLSTLTGEVHATIRNAAVADAQLIDNAVIGRMESLDTRSGFWGRYLLNRAHDDANGNANATNRNGWGAVGGIDARIGDARVGFGAGYTDSSLYSAAIRSIGRYESVHIFGYAGGDLGPVTLRSGAGFSWVKNKTDRRAIFPGINERFTANYDARIFHSFAEAGVPLTLGGGSAEPFVGFQAYRVDSDGFTETGNAAMALKDGRQQNKYYLGQLGLRSEAELNSDIVLRSRVAWQHVFGDGMLDRSMTLRAGGVPFEIVGNGLARNSATASVEVSFRASDQIAASIGYDGLISKDNAAGSFRATVSVGF
jgi:outer membrane autotransporter protein